MKIKVRWSYTFLTCHVFEEIVDVGDENDDAIQTAKDGATMVPNGDLTPVETFYPGDPVDEIEVAAIVGDEAVATIRYTDSDQEPELLPSIAEPGLAPLAQIIAELRAPDSTKADWFDYDRPYQSCDRLADKLEALAARGDPHV